MTKEVLQMTDSLLFCAFMLLLGTFISSISQVMLKKAADKHYDSAIKEYLNPLVIGAYSIFILSTFMSILAYKGIPLSMGPILEATGYFYVTFFGVKIFGEKLNRGKIIALALIIVGIVAYSFG
ncbi:MAG: EamA family transporter [Lachnospiraceae bacterium]|nr:EamA family transporter [Lachnospiraceae bacterium]